MMLWTVVKIRKYLHEGSTVRIFESDFYFLEDALQQAIDKQESEQQERDRRCDEQSELLATK